MEHKYELNKNLKTNVKTEYSYEKELSADVVIPDYCDDVSRIIRVDAKPIVKNKYFSGNSVKLNGIAAITVLYISEPYKQLKSFSFANDFDYELSAEDSNKDCDMTVEMEIGELNCRLLNPRKLSVKIQNDIIVSFYLNNDEEEILSSPEYGAENDIQKLEQFTAFMTVKTGEGELKTEENITVEDELAVNEIIYADVNVIIDDIKPIYNKAVIKFTSDVKCLYSASGEKTGYKTVTKKIPSTMIIDIDDVDENFECTAKAKLSSLKTDIDSDPYGESKVINVEFVVKIELKAYKNNEKSVIADAYSPKYENTSQNVTLTTQKFKNVKREKFEVEDSIMLEDLSIKTVTDLTGIVMINEMNIVSSTLSLVGTAEMAVTVQDEEGEIQNLDCSIPLKNDINLHEIIPNASCEGNAVITEMKAVVEAGRLTVSLTVLYECVVTQKESFQIIKTLVIDNEKEKVFKRDVQMVLYYPQNSETLWSIAKKYNTSMERIAKYNKCENGKIDDRKIIVVPV